MAAAAGAAMAGLGWGIWRHRLGPAPVEAQHAVWRMAFEQPHGDQPFHMASLRGRAVVLNFWATWCPPCVEEMPLLDIFFRQNAANGWHVVGLAIDQAAPVRAFLQRVPVTFPIGLAGLAGADLGRDLGNLTGALPFTVVFGRDGAVLQRKIGQVQPSDLDQWRRALQS